MLTRSLDGILKVLWSAFRYLFGELSGGRDKPFYERINAYGIVFLFIILIVLLILMFAQSLRTLILGEPTPLRILGFAGFESVLILFGTLWCFQKCTSHRAEQSRANQLRRRL